MMPGARAILFLIVAAGLMAQAHPALADPGVGASSAPTRHVRIITDTFVLSGKLEKLSAIAAQADLKLDHIYVESGMGEAKEWIKDIDLVILDTPRPMDLAKVEQRVGAALRASQVPWIRIGGGPPAFGNIPEDRARAWIGFYASGGEENARTLFAAISAWGTDTQDTHAAPKPAAVSPVGFYHPAAPHPFASPDDYLAWGRERWKPNAPRVGIIIHRGLVSSMETQAIDALVHASEARGLLPFVFWFEPAPEDALERAVGSAKIDVLVIATHLQNGPRRAEEFLKLGVPVLQTINYRNGDGNHWDAAQSGIPQPFVAPFLALPETWGISDPMVVDAVENGAPTPIPTQVEALVAKIARLAALRRKPAHAKRIALMFWNYPPGEKNLSASHLNVPKSLEKLIEALASAGYDVPKHTEAELIRAAQRMMEGVYRPESLADLLAKGLAESVPVAKYRRWLDTLPPSRRAELAERWGDPDQDPFVTQVAGEAHFVIPRLKLGKLIVMPQLPRSGRPGESYHDLHQAPGHAYFAAYLFVREVFSADALIHLGTHGTQEWTPGKDRGLAASDYPFLAVGDLPVIYPYIQDNVAEAIQAKRRGRAVTVSHQTPPFAPAGLYDELRDLKGWIEEYAQLDDGPVRDRTGATLRDAVVSANLHRDMDWSEERIEADFAAFVPLLQDHIHALSRHAMPLGLHTFGVPAAADHRLTTVMQQLGAPFHRRAGSDLDTVFAGDAAALRESSPYRLLQRYVRDGAPLSEVSDPDLRADLVRAADLDRHLSDTDEIPALMSALEGRFVAPGAGGDPIRNPDVPSGRNLFGFEPDRVPTRAAYEAGGEMLTKLVESYRQEHDGAAPTQLAFSLWATESMRHLGVLEAQVLHALGLRPVWNEAGRVVALDIIPAAELGRPRIDSVLQVTSVYRDQFDGFMRLLAEAIDKLAATEAAGNPIAARSETVAHKLVALGYAPGEARRLAALRIFSNAPGDYGTDLPDATLRSTDWESSAPLADSFLSRLKYAYGAKDWGLDVGDINLFAEQLKGTEAAVLSRSSQLNGLLSTDHPFEYLGGLALAIRHLDGRDPSLYIADLRETTSRVASAARHLADEVRTRALNPYWISAMQQEGYAGTLELLNATNNLWGWQVTAPSTVRADQWQLLHDTFVNDIRELGLRDWFEEHNPTAQGQIIERLIEAIRKGYWDASEATRKELVERWDALSEQHDVSVGEAATRSYVSALAVQYGIDKSETVDPQRASSEQAGEQVSGPLLQEAAAARDADAPLSLWIGLVAVLLCILAGVLAQIISNRRQTLSGAAE